MANKKVKKKPDFNWAVPKELGIPSDPLRLRLDFHHQATVMTYFEGDTVATKLVSAMDVAHTLANELSFCSGLLPDNTLWWRNTRGGPVYALYVEPKIWKVALQENIDKPARRFTIPLPGLIFLCSPCQAPWVYAVKKRPTKEADEVDKAPLLNVHENGKSCAGSHRYPPRVQDMVQSFFTAFFSNTADYQGRSAKFPNSVVKLWEFLDKKSTYPLEDLVKHGTVSDLMEMEMD